MKAVCEVASSISQDWMERRSNLKMTMFNIQSSLTVCLSGILIFFLVLAVLSFQMGPDRPNFQKYCVSDPKLVVGTRPGPFRATFRPAKKGIRILP